MVQVEPAIAADPGLETPELSIVMPCLNEAKTVGTCVTKAFAWLQRHDVRGEVIVADNGSAWYISGAPDSRWSDDDLHNLTTLTGADFEVVDVSPMMINANSAEAGTCDLNDDGVVNVIDIQMEIDATLGLRACGAGDLNGDGVCNSIDVQRVINAALGQPCQVGP